MVGNVHEYSVTELSSAVKRTLEDGFGFVRVRGELGRVTRPASGHVYLDLKDDRAVLSGVMWKGNAARLAIRPEQGMEVIATGRISTFPGQSRYQLIIDTLEPAGVGALMAMFEERKKKLASEGLFAGEHKKPLPVLPDVIGVVTSPSGAVIRDILHRLRDRFPRHVLVWPTLVQGKGADQTIAAAIRGFNRLTHDGDIPRPDVLIVARGGGSLEDLWCFNEEIVARAAFESDIPLISAVGHETDTTLIDFVSDRRAPTPTAAAELAVPVRSDLLTDLLTHERRLVAGEARLMERARGQLLAAGRGLGRPEDLLAHAVQRLDRAGEQLRSALQRRLATASTRLAATRLGAGTLTQARKGFAERLEARAGRLARLAGVMVPDRAARLQTLRLPAQIMRRRSADHRRQIDALAQRLNRAGVRLLPPRRERLLSQIAMLNALSHERVLERGFAIVRNGDGQLVRSVGSLSARDHLHVQLADGLCLTEVIETAPTGASAANHPVNHPGNRPGNHPGKHRGNRAGDRTGDKNSGTAKSVMPVAPRQTNLFDE